MNLNLGKTGDPLNKVVKNITFPEGYSFTGNLREDCDVVDPVIEIETTSNLSGFNYAYIPEFGRYYHINKLEVTGAKFWRLTLHCDVLHTYASGIKSSPCIVAMSNNRFNMYLPDSNYKAYQDDIILINRFPNGFNLNDAQFVLTAFCETTT